MFGWMRRRFSSRPPKPKPKEDLDSVLDETDEKLDILESKMKQLDAIQARLEEIATTSRERRKESLEAQDELRKTMSQRLSPDVLKRLTEMEEEDDAAAAPPFGRGKLPSGAG